MRLCSSHLQAASMAALLQSGHGGGDARRLHRQRDAVGVLRTGVQPMGSALPAALGYHLICHLRHATQQAQIPA